MITHSKKLGVIVGVEGDVSQVGMYHMTNEAEFIWYGDILTGPKIGAYLTINQNEVKIIATVSTEKIIDQQNTIKSTEFDNRYAKNSINRIITLKVKGVINEDVFEVTSQYVPMIGNEVTLTTQEELKIIYGVDNIEETILIGESILEGQPIRLPIDKFFASHIGIFGNTGSGKSNTLHKLFLELFRTKYYENIIKKSQFFIIDFNGEYIGENMFAVKEGDKEIFEVNTRSEEKGRKLPVKENYLFDADILSILFDARPATQVPFLRVALRTYKEKVKDADSFASIEIGLLMSIIKGTKSVAADALDNWIAAAEDIGVDSKVLQGLEDNSVKNNFGNLEIRSKTNTDIMILKDGQITIEGKQELKIDDIEHELKSIFFSASPIQKLNYFLQFQKVYVSAWKSANIEHINPLFNRIRTSFDSLEKVIEVRDDISGSYKAMNLISLVHANQEITRLIPMLISKMIYDEHRYRVSIQNAKETKHLIIDEAHNILNAEYRNTGDDWQDYRLSVFEEIIKEGRKFGYYLTLASQRPADISSTILSQTHNYLIHRLVNDIDLRMLENTMPTLDKSSFQMIPSLGKGEVIITGNAMQVPVFVKIPKEEIIRPNSDDIILTDLWGGNSAEA
ncbi:MULTISPECIES: ATP-binding protein [Clostridia]|uniref:ATP-binding protein n=1 Tax=Clostridia TaxID=186801 RepID=UPI000EA2446D|nr:MULTISPECIES: ATP-binding protein [Clostridia]NBJ71623.1 ATP-binding protein [Roseburia sp. 1XD42-34]RKI74046.1 ATP-binding protein [Clostridium sp. 1xD42-85]